MTCSPAAPASARRAAPRRDEMLRRLPTLEPEGLRGGVLYHDGQFDDARLLINLAMTAAEHGAALLNYAPVSALTRTATGTVDGWSPRTSRRAASFAYPRASSSTRPAPSRTRSGGSPSPAAIRCSRRARGCTSCSTALPAGRHGAHGAAHGRRPRDVRDPLARTHARRHDRHARRRRPPRAAAAGGGSRLPAAHGRPLSPPGAGSGRRPQRLHRHPSTRRHAADARDGGALARPHDPHRSLRSRHDDRRQVDDLPADGRRDRRSRRVERRPPAPAVGDGVAGDPRL